MQQIYQQAKNDVTCTFMTGMGYECVITKGCKIVRDNKSGEVQILNIMSGAYYANLNSEQLEVFKLFGWKIGVNVLNLYNFRLKLDIIEQKIKDEMTGRGSQKQLSLLKDKREEILKKYSQINYKLNNIKAYGNYKNNNYSEEGDY